MSIPIQPNTLKLLIDEMGQTTESQSVSIYEDLRDIDLRYLQREPFNEGGIKKILRTVDEATGREVAMAILHDPSSQVAVENFLREARITAHLEHPNIVPVYDIGLDDGIKPYFTMKLLSGENLRRILRGLQSGDKGYLKKYRLPDLLDVFQKVCEAMSYAHASGVIHLDLKPGNIQVNDYGDVLICDWGLAKIVNSTCEAEYSILDDASLYASCVNFLTVDGMFKGTPGYMAPEQAYGGQKSKDERTDVYALGCILYTILTSECPIEGTNVEDILKRTREGDFIRPRKRAPKKDIPVGLEAVVLKAMALRPDDRYQTVMGMLRDLQAYRNGFATRAEDAGFMTQLKLLGKRNPKVVASTGLALLGLALITTFYTSKLKENERQARITLVKYEEEREKRQRIESAPLLYSEAQDLYKRGFFDDAFDKVNQSVAADRNLYRAWELKGYLHFIRMEFEAASAVFKRAENTAGNQWANLSARFASVKKNEDGNFDVMGMLNRLRGAGSRYRSRPISSMIETYKGQNLEVKSRLALARGLLRLDGVKGPHDFFNFEERTNGYAIDLSRSIGFVNLNALQYLPVVSLDLSYTSLKNHGVLASLPLTSLNLSNTSGITSLDLLSGMKLEELNLSNSQINKLQGLSSMEIRRLNIVGVPLDRRWLDYILKDCQVSVLVVSPSQIPNVDYQSRLQSQLELEFHYEL